MKRILIIPNQNKDRDFFVSTKAAKMLCELGACVFVEEKYETSLSGYAVPIKDTGREFDLIIVVGGDGSVLDASPLAIDLGIAILGINLGKLGYLADKYFGILYFGMMEVGDTVTCAIAIPEGTAKLTFGDCRIVYWSQWAY